ncbi:MAG: RluA family pseudouridine synthase [Halobacteriovoraceae bacterium]|nr:RluA family pseudouridine synthase [Halobacteriovoraceae bacterium]
MKKNKMIIFENDDFIVANKPCGLMTMGSRSQDSLYARLLEYLKQKGHTRLYAVHRLDKDCSGLLVFAKDRLVYKEISELFQNRKVSKKYYAIVDSGFSELYDRTNLPEDLRHNVHAKNETLTIKLPLYGIKTKSRVDKTKGKQAITEVKIKDENAERCLLDINLKTGRFHQIRCHLSYLGYPIIGDELYKSSHLDSRLLLHSYYLSFKLLGIKKPFVFKSPIPPEFTI